MAAACAGKPSNPVSLPKTFRKEILSKLSFLGLNTAESPAVQSLWEFLNHSAKSAPNRKAASQLLRLLAAELGPPRAKSFIAWLAERRKQQPMGIEDAPVKPTSAESLQLEDAPVKPQKVPNLKLHLEDAVKAKKAPSPQLEDAPVEPHRAPSPEPTAVQEPVEDAPVKPPRAPSLQQNAPVKPQRTPQARRKEKLQKLLQAAPEGLAASKNITESETWVKLASPSGEVYYWNRLSKACTWQAPAGVEIVWSGQRCSDGRTYFWKQGGDGKDARWALPPLQEKKMDQELFDPEEPVAVDSMQEHGQNKDEKDMARTQPELESVEAGENIEVDSPKASSRELFEEAPQQPLVEEPMWLDLGPFEAVLKTYEGSVEAEPQEPPETVAVEPQPSETALEVVQVSPQLAVLAEQRAKELAELRAQVAELRKNLVELREPDWEEAAPDVSASPPRGRKPSERRSSSRASRRLPSSRKASSSRSASLSPIRRLPSSRKASLSRTAPLSPTSPAVAPSPASTVCNAKRSRACSSSSRRRSGTHARISQRSRSPARSPSSKARSRPSKARSPSTKARSRPSKARSPSTKARSPLSKARSRPSKARSLSTKARSPPSKARSPSSKACSKRRSPSASPTPWRPRRSPSTASSPKARSRSAKLQSSKPRAELRKLRSRRPSPQVTQPAATEVHAVEFGAEDILEKFMTDVRMGNQPSTQPPATLTSPCKPPGAWHDSPSLDKPPGVWDLPPATCKVLPAQKPLQRPETAVTRDQTAPKDGDLDLVPKHLRHLVTDVSEAPQDTRKEGKKRKKDQTADVPLRRRLSLGGA